MMALSLLEGYATVAQVITLYNHARQKSSSDWTVMRCLRYNSRKPCWLSFLTSKHRYLGLQWVQVCQTRHQFKLQLQHGVDDRVEIWYQQHEFMVSSQQLKLVVVLWMYSWHTLGYLIIFVLYTVWMPSIIWILMLTMCILLFSQLTHLIKAVPSMWQSQLKLPLGMWHRVQSTSVTTWTCSESTGWSYPVLLWCS